MFGNIFQIHQGIAYQNLMESYEKVKLVRILSDVTKMQQNYSGCYQRTVQNCLSDGMRVLQYLWHGHCRRVAGFRTDTPIQILTRKRHFPVKLQHLVSSIPRFFLNVNKISPLILNELIFKTNIVMFTLFHHKQKFSVVKICKSSSSVFYVHFLQPANFCRMGFVYVVRTCEAVVTCLEKMSCTTVW